jgi:exodeoxyribonuclease-5
MTDAEDIILKAAQGVLDAFPSTTRLSRVQAISIATLRLAIDGLNAERVFMEQAAAVVNGPVIETKPANQTVEQWIEELASDHVYVPQAKAPVLMPSTEGLTADQLSAWNKLVPWCTNAKPYFILRGFAGTGKTYLMRMMQQMPGITVFFSAPTNKATKVLSASTNTDARTTFSLLGLRMEQHEDRKELSFKNNEIPYIPKGAIVVIDEASMCGADLVEFVKKVVAHNGCKVLIVGDPAQLPPVKENVSPAWKLTDDKDCRAVLREVKRFDNELLALSLALRECLATKHWASPIRSDNSKGGGVFQMRQRQFSDSMLGITLDQFQTHKVLAWRNATVDKYTERIRENLGFTYEYSEGEHLMLAAPVEEGGHVVAHIDEELRIDSRHETKITIEEREIPVFELQCSGDSTLKLRIAQNTTVLDDILAKKARKARGASHKGIRAQLWRDFWDVKNKFHDVRYGYAMTIHRSQGSTYDSVWLDQMDVLVNSEKKDAFRALYVGSTRPSKALYTN